MAEEKKTTLEEAARLYAIPHYMRDVDVNYLDEYPYNPVAEEDFIAGARWQKEQMISALKNDGELPIEFIDKFHEIDRNAFQNGQKNVKEQMLKETVEGNVVELGETYKDLSIFVGAKELNEVLQSLGVKDGDKVKVIIVKEAEK